MKIVFQPIALAYLIHNKVGGKKGNMWLSKQIIRLLLMSGDQPEKVSFPISSCFLRNKASELHQLSGQYYMELIPDKGFEISS